MKTDARLTRKQPPELIPDAWREAAQCARTDPEVFYPEKGHSPKAAKRICANCAVISECLTHAISTNERYGVWGGLTETERRVITRQVSAA